MSWVILLMFANDYVKTDRTIAIICVVGAIVLAALKVFHKVDNAAKINKAGQPQENISSSNNSETE